MISARALLSTLAVLVATSSCTSASGACDGPPGLYVDDACTEIAPDLVAYEPAFPLWTDGAAKERYVRLPPGGVIDGSDPDGWVFPVGTTFYKTFSLDGVRLETRMMRKVREGSGVGAWEMRAYAWDADQRHVRDVTSDVGCPDCASLRTDVLGTDHDIPDGTTCRGCHSASRDVVNGFSAIQLADGSTGLSLDGLVASGALAMDADVARAIAVPGSGDEHDALASLHANCGHCHRAGGDASACAGGDCCRTPACLTGLRLSLHVADVTPAETDAYLTAVGRPAIYTGTSASCLIAPGYPDESVLFLRMSARGTPDAMPPIGTEHVDPDAIALMRRWIESLPPGATTCAH